MVVEQPTGFVALDFGPAFGEDTSLGLSVRAADHVGECAQLRSETSADAAAQAPPALVLRRAGGGECREMRFASKVLLELLSFHMRELIAARDWPNQLIVPP